MFCAAPLVEAAGGGAFLLFTGIKLACAKDEDEGKGMGENFFVRLVGPRNEAVLVSVPPEWIDYQSSEFAVGGVRLRHDDPDLRARGTGDERLATVDHPMIAVERRGGLHHRRVGPCAPVGGT